MPEEKNNAQTQQEEPKLTQAQVDSIVKERVAREREKYADYDDLKKFKTEHEKQLDAEKQKKLEEEGKYKEAMTEWQKKEEQYKKSIEEANARNRSLQVDTALSLEISKFNAYPEAKDILKPLVVLDDDGMPKIPGKDANGIDTKLPLADGVKKFLEERPYLVKASQSKGGNTPSNNATGGEAVKDLTSLNNELIQAQTAGDYTKVKEVKAKINTYFTSKGIQRTL